MAGQSLLTFKGTEVKSVIYCSLLAVLNHKFYLIPLCQKINFTQVVNYKTRR